MGLRANYKCAKLFGLKGQGKGFRSMNDTDFNKMKIKDSLSNVLVGVKLS